MATARPRWRRPTWWVLVGVLLALLLVVVFWKQLVRQYGINLDTGAAGQARLTLPAGFQANIFTSGLNGPRFMAVDANGLLFVAERGRGRVVALPDRDHDGHADEQIVVATNLNDPTSLTFDGAQLIVGEADKVTRLTLDGAAHETGRTVLIPDLPAIGVHTTKTVMVGPDGHLYLAMGSSCNVCDEGDPRRAAVSIYNLDGSGGRVFSRGLRNAVGLAVNPVTQAIWATTNGRDFLGDDRPPETVNILRDGANFGWPRCHAGTLVDPDFGGAQGCTGVSAPTATMAAHMAPLGLAFYQGSTAFPADYRSSLYIAFHGSWNSTHFVGYKVMRLPLRDGAVAGPAVDFATGWLADEQGATGRPAGIVQGADGSLLVSDDKGGFIYRISYGGP